MSIEIKNVLMPHSGDPELLDQIISACREGRHIIVCSDSDTYLDAICYASYKIIGATDGLTQRRLYPAVTEELLKTFNKAVDSLTIDEAIRSSSVTSRDILIIPEVRGFSASDWTILTKLLKTFVGANVSVLIFSSTRSVSEAAISDFVADLGVQLLYLPVLTATDLESIKEINEPHLQEKAKVLFSKLSKDFLGAVTDVEKGIELADIAVKRSGRVWSLLLVLMAILAVSSIVWFDKRFLDYVIGFVLFIRRQIILIWDWLTLSDFQIF